MKRHVGVLHRPDTVQELVSYLDGHPATADLARTMALVTQHRRSGQGGDALSFSLLTMENAR